MAARKPAKKAAKVPRAQQPAAKKVKPAPSEPVGQTRRRSANYSEEEKAAALETVIACAGNTTEAARLLGIEPRTLRQWTNGINVSQEVYSDYSANARARVVERLTTIHATQDEVLSLLASHLRGDLADYKDCFKENGQLDLQLCKRYGVSRGLKKLKIRAIPHTDAKDKVQYEYVTEIEIHDPQSAAAKLITVYGMNKQPDDNPAKLQRQEAYLRAAERKRIELVQEKGWTLEAANKLVAEIYPEASTLIQ